MLLVILRGRRPQSAKDQANGPTPARRQREQLEGEQKKSQWGEAALWVFLDAAQRIRDTLAGGGDARLPVLLFVQLPEALNLPRFPFLAGLNVLFLKGRRLRFLIDAWASHWMA